MKTKKTLLISLVVLAVIGAIGMLQVSQNSWLGAQIFQEDDPSGIRYFPVEGVRNAAPSSGFTYEPSELNINVHSNAPVAPEYLNSFNMYAGGVSELELLERYKQYVKGGIGKVQMIYLNETISYLDRLTKRKDFFADKLPIWPETTVATYGTMMAYLFPDEPNPLLYGKATGLIPMEAKSQSFMNRAELIHIVQKIFMSPNINAAQELTTMGIIDGAEKWNDTSQDGFLLLEAIRIVLDVVDVIEYKQIQAAKTQYINNLVALPEGELTMDEAVLKVLYGAFVKEYHQQFGNRPLDNRQESRFLEATVGLRNGPLTSPTIAEARAVFYEALNREVPPVYQMPDLQLVGDCRELHKKVYFGAVAVTGEEGAGVICEKVLVQFPKNSFIINGFSFPDTTIMQSKSVEGRSLIKTDSLKTYLNTLIVSEEGESMLKVSYRPENLESFYGEDFKLVFSNHADEPEVAIQKAYNNLGAQISLDINEFVGDHYVRFQH